MYAIKSAVDNAIDKQYCLTLKAVADLNKLWRNRKSSKIALRYKFYAFKRPLNWKPIQLAALIERRFEAFSSLRITQCISLLRLSHSIKSLLFKKSFYKHKSNFYCRTDFLFIFSWPFYVGFRSIKGNVLCKSLYNIDSYQTHHHICSYVSNQYSNEPRLLDEIKIQTLRINDLMKLM